MLTRKDYLLVTQAIKEAKCDLAIRLTSFYDLDIGLTSFDEQESSGMTEGEYAAALGAINDLTVRLAGLFARNNRRFNLAKFYLAAGYDPNVDVMLPLSPEAYV